MTMTETATAPATDAIDLPFIKTLIKLIRAEDQYGSWDKKPDAQLLEGFVVTKEERKNIPIIGDPDPDTMHRVEQFYRAVSLRVEEVTQLMASPHVSLSHEGFGRVFVTVGKLVAYSKTLRDIHRFGYDDLAALAAAGDKELEKALKTIEEYPAVARD